MTDIAAKLSEIESSLSRFIPEQRSRMLQVEQKLTAPRGSGGGGYAENDLGYKVISSDQFKSFQGSNLKTSGQISVGSFQTKTNLVSAGGLGQPLVPP